MKTIVSISLGSSTDDYEFDANFLGESFKIKRLGTDGNIDRACDLILRWNHRADAIGIGSIKYPYTVDNKQLVDKSLQKIEKMCLNLKTPVTMGNSLRNVAFEWSLRHLQFKLNGYFTNIRAFFLSGMDHYNLAKIMLEFSENLMFADPVMENGIPKFLNSFKELELYAKGLHNVLNWIPTKSISGSTVPIKDWNRHVIHKAIQSSQAVLVPDYNFYDYIKDCSLEELGGKTVISSTIYDDRIEFLKDRGVDMIVDCTPKVLDRVIGVNVIEAMIIAALGKPKEEITDDDLLEVISEQKMEPRVIYPGGSQKKKSRFAFVIHPLSQEDFKKEKSLKMISKFTPSFFLDTIEKIMAYSPPFLYSKVEGIKSPTGVEAEGWLISVGGTPKQMMSHKPEFTYKRLLQAARMAKRLGAQIMGLGAFTKVVGDAGVTVARQASIPITTGNSYSASGALWAAADAVRRMGLIEYEKGKKLKAKTMVVGATGAIGSVCCRLLAKAFEEVYMVGRNMAKLLSLKEEILEETPDVKVYLSTRADSNLQDMDVIVTATSGIEKKIIDIMKVKPGCVITDVARPLDIPAKDVAKRPDVLVIESGEILLPGDIKMKNIGLPRNVVYACLAETIVLALEGRFEIFTIGRDIEWQKVREIYKMGLKHGMRLAAISGINGVFTDEDIDRVKELAMASRKNKE
ncbi:MAG: dehydrogenase [Desulfobacterales bacterium]|nr:dehydrogenase [Desulfobacterales bacterium]